jgi:hypothetical protein
LSRFLILILGVSFSISCNNEKLDTGLPIGTKVELTHRAGDYYLNDEFLALPFNLGVKVDEVSTNDSPQIILGSRIDEPTASVKPIARLNLLVNDDELIYVVNKMVSDTSALDFDKLLTSHASMKSIIEQYLIYQNGIGNAEIISWEGYKQEN